MKVVAHRCGAGEAPENTIQAIEACIKIGVTILQLDVMMTKDKQVVLFHDMPEEKNMQKVTGVDGDIADFAYDDLPKMKSKLIPNMFCPEGSLPIMVDKSKRGGIDLFTEAAGIIASDKGQGVSLILEFWQDDTELIAKTFDIVNEHKLECRIMAWGSPMKETIQKACVNQARDIPVIVTLKQAFYVWTCWNVLPRFLFARVAKTMFDDQKKVFNVPVPSLESWPRVLCEMNTIDAASWKASFLNIAVKAFKRWTDTPALYQYLRDEWKVPTVLFLINTRSEINHVLDRFPMALALQTDYPALFMTKF